MIKAKSLKVGSLGSNMTAISAKSLYYDRNGVILNYFIEKWCGILRNTNDQKKTQNDEEETLAQTEY